jgi:DNA primase
MEFVDQLKQSVSIVDVIGEVVRLKKSGTRYTGLCPFHNEKTPSFSVNPQHQFFKCFGCNEGGDVVSFVMKHEGLSFYEALKSLAERSGIQMPKRTGFADEETKVRSALHRMHELAEAEFRRQLAGDAGAEARRYLTGRGVGRESIEMFALGYAPRTNAITKLLQREGFTAEELEQSGLVLKREDGTFFDRFRNRLMFPIHNESGKPIAFGGRALSDEDQPKYLNSAETRIYRKSSVLYNMHRAKEAIRKEDRVVLVEGYMDVIGVYAAGVHEVIASCGTALTAQQIQGIRRHSMNIVVNFDPDAAGANATERSSQLLLAEGMRMRILSLEGGLDPDEYCRQHGAEAYREQVKSAPNYFHWLAGRARARFDMRSADGRYQAFQFLLPAIQSLTDKLERVAVANDVAGYLGVESALVLDNFRKMAADRGRASAPSVRETLRHTDRILISVLLSSPEQCEELIGYIKPLPSLRSGVAGKVYEALIAMHEAGSPITYAALNGRLEQRDQDLLASAFLAGDGEAQAATQDEAYACVEAMVAEERERERAALKTRIKEAERAGDHAQAMTLSVELHRLSARA